MTTKTDEHGPNVPYQAITMLKGVKQYGDELAESVRHIKQYSPKDLEAKGITKNIESFKNRRSAKPICHTNTTA